MGLCKLFGTSENGCGFILPLIIAYVIFCCCDFDVCEFVEDVFDNADACTILLTIVFFLHVTGYFCDRVC